MAIFSTRCILNLCTFNGGDIYKLSPFKHTYYGIIFWSKLFVQYFNKFWLFYNALTCDDMTDNKQPKLIKSQRKHLKHWKKKQKKNKRNWLQYSKNNFVQEIMPYLSFFFICERNQPCYSPSIRESAPPCISIVFDLYFTYIP